MRYSLEGPLEQAAESQPAPAAAPPSPGAAAAGKAGEKARLRILVVEDEPLAGLQLRSDLKDAHHQVLGPAQTLAQGLELSKGELDIALLDFSLGNDNTVPIAEGIAARHIPFAFATGYSDPSFIPEPLRHAPRLKKPYSSEELLRVVGELSSTAEPAETPA